MHIAYLLIILKIENGAASIGIAYLIKGTYTIYQLISYFVYK